MLVCRLKGTEKSEGIVQNLTLHRDWPAPKAPEVQFLSHGVGHTDSAVIPRNGFIPAHQTLSHCESFQGALKVIPQY